MYRERHSMEAMLFATVFFFHTLFNLMLHELNCMHGTNDRNLVFLSTPQYTKPCYMVSSIWHVRSTVGRRGHVTLHRHLLPTGATGLQSMLSLGQRSWGQTCHKNQVQVSELHGSKHGCEDSYCLSVVRISDNQLLAICQHCHKSSSFFCLSVLIKTSISRNT